MWVWVETVDLWATTTTTSSTICLFPLFLRVFLFHAQRKEKGWLDRMICGFCGGAHIFREKSNKSHADNGENPLYINYLMYLPIGKWWVCPIPVQRERKKTDASFSCSCLKFQHTTLNYQDNDIVMNFKIQGLSLSTATDPCVSSDLVCCCFVSVTLTK